MIRRHHATYCVPREHPNPERLRARLDDRFQPSRAASALALALERLRTCDSIVFVRRLDVDLNVRANGDTNAIEAAWARRVATTLATRLARMQSRQGDVVRFENRASYLAAFLGDVVDGVVEQRWYHRRQLETLGRSSGTSRVAVTLCREPACGWRALAMLRETCLRQLLDGVTEGDARQIHEAWRAVGVVEAPDRTAEILVEVWDRVFEPKASDRGSEVTILRWCVAAARHVMSDRPVSRSAMARAILAVRSSGLNPSRDFDFVSADRLRNAGFEPCDVEPLRRCSRETRARIAARWEAPLPPEPETTSTEAVVRTTRAGGAVLLLPLLAEWTCDPRSRRERNEIEANVRLRVLSACLGRENDRATETDPVLRSWCGVECDASRADVDDALPRSLIDEVSTFTLRAFARRIPGMAASSFEYLQRNFLDFEATVTSSEGLEIVTACRPPLGILLEINGMMRARFEVPWLPGRRFVVEGED